MHTHTYTHSRTFLHALFVKRDFHARVCVDEFSDAGVQHEAVHPVPRGQHHHGRRAVEGVATGMGTRARVYTDGNDTLYTHYTHHPLLPATIHTAHYTHLRTTNLHTCTLYPPAHELVYTPAYTTNTTHYTHTAHLHILQTLHTLLTLHTLHTCTHYTHYTLYPPAHKLVSGSQQVLHRRLSLLLAVLLLVDAENGAHTRVGVDVAVHTHTHTRIISINNA
jgi:hypothetical protein